MPRKILLTATLLFVGGTAPFSVAVEPVRLDTIPLDRKFIQLIKPQPEEALWDEEIPWETSVRAARLKAAAEGKPIYLFLGAGEPLGNV